MKKAINFLLLAASMTAGLVTSSHANQLDDLLKQVKAYRISEAKLYKKREAEFMAARADKQVLLNKAKKELARQDARNKRLTSEYAANEIINEEVRGDEEDEPWLVDVWKQLKMIANKTNGICLGDYKEKVYLRNLLSATLPIKRS